MTTTTTKGRRRARTATDAVKPDAIRHRLAAMRAALVGAFVSRDAIIDTLIVGLVAGTNVALLGLPGTAKSELANAFAKALGAKAFAWQLTKLTAADEVFGPPSLSGLKADRFTRVTRGKLPEAEVAFLDEAFKSNSAVLNALLTALNERAFYDDDGAHPIPLRFAIAASNEYPGSTAGGKGASNELAALWDRFAIRHWVEHTTSPAEFEKLLDLAVGLDGQGAKGGLGSVPKGISSVADVDVARAEAAKLPFDAATVKAMYAVRAELAGRGIHMSDRRSAVAAKVARAHAWIQGDDSVMPGHLAVLDSVLWDHHDQRPTVVEALSKHCASSVADARRALDAFATFEAEKLKAIEASENPIGECGLLVKQAKRLVEKLQGIASDASNAEASKVAKLVTVAEGKRNEHARRRAELSGMPTF